MSDIKKVVLAYSGGLDGQARMIIGPVSSVPHRLTYNHSSI